MGNGSRIKGNEQTDSSWERGDKEGTGGLYSRSLV